MLQDTSVSDALTKIVDTARSESLYESKKKDSLKKVFEFIDSNKIESDGDVSVIPQFPRDVFMDTKRIIRNPINRDERRRLKKVGKLLKVHNQTHDTIALFVVRLTIKITTKDGDKYVIEPGVYLGNGNTRRLWYSKNPNQIPKTKFLNAICHEVTTGKQYEDLYDSYDSDDAVEKSAEKIQGALIFMGVKVNSTRAKSGSFGSALSMAYGDWKASAKDRVSNFKSEIELVDKVGMFNPSDGNFKFQTMYAMALIVARFWNEPNKVKDRMISGLQWLAKIEFDTLDSSPQSWDGLTAIAYEVFHPGRKGWIPMGDLASTKVASIDPQLDFFLYCFEKYMENRKLDKSKGFKKYNWKGKYNEIANLLQNRLQ